MISVLYHVSIQYGNVMKPIKMVKTKKRKWYYVYIKRIKPLEYKKLARDNSTKTDT